MKNQIHIDSDFGWFMGGFDDNQKHKHYGIQLSIPLENSISIKTSDQTITTASPILIQSNVDHQIISNSRHFLLLVNPASTIGHFWKNLTDTEIRELNFPPAFELKDVLTDSALKMPRVEEVNKIIRKHDCFCSSAVHHGDERINKVLAYLKDHFDRVVSIEEAAGHCHLSPSRFLHLFKEQTGITYRRAQLWTKIVRGLLLIGEKSFTEIAYTVGFADSAHFSRTFKENFGFSPREFSRFSQFIQV